MPDVPGARAGHGRRQLRGDVLQGALAARRALLLNGRHQRPPHAHGVGAQGQSLEDVHAVLKGAVHKDGDFPRRVFTISGRTSSAGTAEAMIPWWWETRTPPAPASKHF